MNSASLGRTVGVYLIFVLIALALLYVMNRFTTVPSNIRVAISTAVAVGVPTLVVSYLNYVS
ncbi:hypothetical protein Hmuk_0966 [Halomicrobium mukohataei DSM 12286]|uniref:Uncharacterized protein n=1 Tax=Halomicrobium mukohataei (strain ATCC 700874 / DSM 12286 / JCM 9738 / NCIMB 13541) TaxID=485914 RepID=C7P187_HALMD|nr:hypothetical protein Hmuk_0966 [Halomicrobium mukohataei DSM 12286]